MSKKEKEKTETVSLNPWERRELAAEKEAGVWVTVAEYPEWSFRVGRDCPWNEAHARAMARVAARPDVRDYIERSAKPGYETSKADREIDRYMVVDAFAEGLLLDWKNVCDREGRPMDADHHEKVGILLSFPDVFAALRKASRDPANFTARTEAEKADIAAGN